SKDHPQGAKCYNAKEEWQEEQKRMLEDVEQEILFVQDEINEVWDDFLNWTDKKICDQEAEIKAVQEWQKNKEQLLK
ncbi:MAG: hypothetical protein RSE07_02870, partial [Oscillospiraceae bacterium]